MARRGGAAAAEDTGGGSDLSSEVESLAPSDSRFNDPVRESPGDTPGESPPPQPSAPPSPTEPGGGVATGPQGPISAPAPEFDPRTEIEGLRRELAIQQQRSGLLERELQFRAAAAIQQAQEAAPPQQQVDPVLQEVLDILQVSPDDLIEVFQGGEKGAQIVTRALQATALLAVQAAERRLIQYYQRDQGARQQAQVVETRAGQMHEAFWTNFPELADHAVIVQHYAAQVAAEQVQAPRFDWESAQCEVAARTVNHLRQVYNMNVTLAQPTGYGMTGNGYAPRPTLQSRLRPAFGEMGSGAARPGNPNAQTQLTAEILDLAR